MNNIEGVITVVISDREGLIITSESRGDAGDESVLGAIAAVIDSYIDRIKREFSEETNFFNILTVGNKKFAYCSMGLKSILLTISDLKVSDTELRVYSEHVAEKIELLLEGNDKISLEIPAILRLLAKTKDGKIPTGQFPLKLILTGDYKVGKTSLILRFVENLFKNSYQSTIGVEISQKILNLSENTKMDFAIWDIGGQITSMAPYRKRFYVGAHAAFIVIDRTREDHLKSIDVWYNDIKTHINANVSVIIIGNKSDLADEVVISEEDIKEIAEKNNFHYILTSAKTGENVDEAFRYIAYKFLENIS
ncbi:MAG: small GTP-binding domain protein [Candidatus Lokiarchaeum sp. GC14_75]|nr:MAG: small GTP-binding domain protein [Candidatus Lokiarchaeum sp. GC14_75]